VIIGSGLNYDWIQSNVTSVLRFNSLFTKEQKNIEKILTQFKSREAKFNAPHLSLKLKSLCLDELAKKRKEEHVPLVAYHPLSETANSCCTEEGVKVMAACTALMELEMYGMAYRQTVYPQSTRIRISNYKIKRKNVFP
jgi:hypothetical protein